jgi:hypothetical protein
MPDQFSRDQAEHKAIQPPRDQGYRTARGRVRAAGRTRGAPAIKTLVYARKAAKRFNSVLVFGELPAPAIEVAGADGFNRWS